MCGCDWDTDSCSPLLNPSGGWRLILVVGGSGGAGVLVAMINQLPAAGSKPVSDTNKWQKWGGFVSQTLEAYG